MYSQYRLFAIKETYLFHYLRYRAAEVYSLGGTLRDVHDMLYSGHEWKRVSKAVSHFTDPYLANFLRRRFNLSFDQFRSSASS